MYTSTLQITLIIVLTLLVFTAVVMRSFWSPPAAASRARAWPHSFVPHRSVGAAPAPRAANKKSPPSRAVSDSEKAGLQWSVSHVRKNIHRHMIQNGAPPLTSTRVGTGAPVYLAAVLEYISAEVLELANNEATKSCAVGSTPMIEVTHVEAAIAKDEELSRFFSSYPAALTSPSAPPHAEGADALADALRVGKVAASALIKLCAHPAFKLTVAPLTALPLAGSSDIFGHGYTDNTEVQDLFDLLSDLNPSAHVSKAEIAAAVADVELVLAAEERYVEAVSAHTAEAEARWHETRKGHVGSEEVGLLQPPEMEPSDGAGQAYVRTMWRRRRVAVVIPSAVRAYRIAAVDAGYRVLRKAYAAEKEPGEAEMAGESTATATATATAAEAPAPPRILKGPHSSFRMSDAASKLLRAVKANA
jgi:hypothetical protein